MDSAASQGITILGSTGSVGRSTLNVIAQHPDRFHIVALTAHRNFDLLAKQCLAFNAAFAVCADSKNEPDLIAALKQHGASAQALSGSAGLEEVVALTETHAVMAAIVGAAGLKPSLRAARCGKRLLLANKESMVIAGELFARAAAENHATIIPVDSEHNALFQALPEQFNGDLEASGVEQLILTASGGPFLDTPESELPNITPEQACDHPNWDMGQKISVDSATLINKGLEVIEAKWLFNARPDQIKVVVHPQSIVHSMVAYRDGSVIAQLGMPDMRTPIAHALAWPSRIEAGVKRLHLPDLSRLEFRQPDLQRFPGLQLAFNALESGGNAPVILNAANEYAVKAFLDRRIRFTDIPALVEQSLQVAQWQKISDLDDVLEADRMARDRAQQEIQPMEQKNA
jgi:1-deoxy-D-xylulose-5-phosphate reductoisomerase